MQEVRIFARLSDGTMRRLVRHRDRPYWFWLQANDVAPLKILGDVVLAVDTLADLPADPTKIGVIS